jgi:hypothetical protein
MEFHKDQMLVQIHYKNIFSTHTVYWELWQMLGIKKNRKLLFPKPNLVRKQINM